MDVKGAVDLSIDATRLRAPETLDEPTHSRLLELGDRQWELPPHAWLEAQLVRLALASVIEARLLHVRQHRLSGFGLPKDPSAVTLRQLAALWREHAGAAGQAFELAVADAVQHGIAEVTEPITQALRLLGIHGTQPPQMLLVGLEKVPADLRKQTAANLLALLPDEAVLRTGLRGRPMSAATVADRMTQATWADMRPAPARPIPQGPEVTRWVKEGFQGHLDSYTQNSQLARADALIYSGRDMVGVSLKINPMATMHMDARFGWRDVPLWITRSSPRIKVTRVRLVSSAKVPMAVVELADNRWTRSFETALRILETALIEIDRGRPRSSMRPGGMADNPADQAARLLAKMADLTVDDVTEELRSVHPAVGLAMRDRILASPSSVSLTTLDEPALLRAWRSEASGGGVYRGQRHLFFRGSIAA